MSGSPSFRTGIATPLSSLRGENRAIGEYGDLASFGRWAADRGFDLLAVLPLTDSGEDSSPYAGITAVALHPIHLDLHRIAGEAGPSPAFVEAERSLARLERVDYTTTLRAKRAELRRLFDTATLGSRRREVEGFARENPWVHEHAAFCIATEANDGRPWWEWSVHRDPDDTTLAAILESAEPDWLFHAWVQMHAQAQLDEAVEALAEVGVSLMGDLPILVQRNSVDVWLHRELFDLSARAGAPPDQYCEEGQDWGFPLYRWSRMRENDYAWWRHRLVQASRYYRALRIDHVLGFFRIWRIENDAPSAMEGHYVPTLALDTVELERAGIGVDLRKMLCVPGGIFEPFESSTETVCLRHEWQKSPEWDELDPIVRQALRRLAEDNEAARDELWGDRGRERLRALQSATDMVLCAEDLGAVPPCVPRVLEELGIAGLKVERWSRAENEADQPFWDPVHFPARSVCSPGLHDASSIRGWWAEIDDATRALYYYRAIGATGPVPSDLDPSTLGRILARNLRASSELVILQWPDCLALDEELRPVDPEDERINWPGTIGDRNWSWRMPLSVEALGEREALARRLDELLGSRRKL